MQTLFALSQSKEANFNIGLEEIEEEFKPDLNSMEAPDHDLLKSNKKKAKSILAHKILGNPLPEGVEMSVESEASAAKAYKNFLNNSAEDVKRLKKEMILDAESLVDSFLWVITLLVAKALAITEAHCFWLTSN